MAFFNSQSKKCDFCFAPFFKWYNAFEKWRYIHVPHRRLLKNEFFNNLLYLTAMVRPAEAIAAGLKKWPCAKHSRRSRNPIQPGRQYRKISTR